MYICKEYHTQPPFINFCLYFSYRSFRLFIMPLWWQVPHFRHNFLSYIGIILWQSVALLRLTEDFHRFFLCRLFLHLFQIYCLMINLSTFSCQQIFSNLYFFYGACHQCSANTTMCAARRSFPFRSLISLSRKRRCSASSRLALPVCSPSWWER